MKREHKDNQVQERGLPEELVGLVRAQWPSLTPSQVQQGWQRLRTNTPSGKRSFYLGFAVMAAAGVILALLSSQSHEITYKVQGGTWQNQRLAVAQDQRASILFSDGTHITAAPRSQTELLQTTRTGARLRLHEGAVALQVKRLAGARWSVAAGPFTVAVKGTTFDMKWEAQTLTVFLQEGRVDVTGPLFDGLVVLRPGQRLVANLATRETRIYEGARNPLDARAPAVLPNKQVADRDAPPAETPLVEPPFVAKTAPPHLRTHGTRSSPPAAPNTKTAWAQQVGRGGFDEVLTQARAFGIEEAVARKPLFELAALADAARYQRQNDIAKLALLSLRKRFSKAPSAKDAAFHLGRLFEGEAKLAEAMRWYNAYLVESPHGTFLCECLGRKLSLLLRATEAGSARPIAHQYLSDCPNGSFAHTARSLEQE